MHIFQGRAVVLDTNYRVLQHIQNGEAIFWLFFAICYEFPDFCRRLVETIQIVTSYAKDLYCICGI